MVEPTMTLWTIGVRTIGEERRMTPEELRARAKATLEAQKKGKVINLRSDGSLALGNDPFPYFQGKKIVLHDPKGEY
jgi:hypothetical protein